MIRILLVSDNHGRMNNLIEVKEKVGALDLVIHMGDAEGTEDKIRNLFDCTVVMVAGNCDHRSREDEEILLELEGHTLFACHGHTRGVNWDLSGMEEAAASYGADIALFGHTHIPQIIYREDLMIINPGSIEKPRQDGRRRSFGLLELKEGVFPCYASIGYLD